MSTAVQNVQVDLRGCDVLVAEQFLDRAGTVNRWET